MGIVLSPSYMSWSVVTVLSTSTSAYPAVFRPLLTLAGRETLVLTDQIRSIDTNYIFGPAITHLTHDQLTEVEHCLARYLGLISC